MARKKKRTKKSTRRPAAGFKGIRRTKIAIRRHKSRGGAFWLPLLASSLMSGE